MLHVLILISSYLDFIVSQDQIKSISNISAVTVIHNLHPRFDLVEKVVLFPIKQWLRPARYLWPQLAHNIMEN